MATVSLIIPTRNRKQLLAVTLHNILKQSVLPDEIIVVDDGSEDGTIEFLKQNFRTSVIVLPNKQRGPGAARNTGFKAATGDFIKFFDSDDLMTRNTIHVQSNELAESRRGFVYGPYFYAVQDLNGHWSQSNPSILNYFPFDDTRPLHYWMAVKNLFITIPGMMFKRDLLVEVGEWRTDVMASEDWDYLWRISMLEPRPLHSNECAFLYRVHGHQTTASHFTNTQRDLDKYKVLIDIYNRDVRNGRKISKWERVVFENKFFQIARMIGDDGSVLSAELKKFRTVFNELVWSFVRLDQKTGRIRTGSDWQPCHGPLKSSRKFDEYLSMMQ